MSCPFAPHTENLKSDIRKALINTKANACPIGIRISWHASGTYDPATKTGGSDGATMRYEPEFSDGANAGITIMIDMLKEVKAANPEVSRADIWALAGASAVEFAGGPKIPFAFGRTDSDGKATPTDLKGVCPAHAVPENGRLPDALLGADHLRELFGKRMGFTDRDIVALSGAHTLGRCHKVRSGFDGPWTDNPLIFDNSYFKNLMENEWQERVWDGKRQFEDKATQRLMMLPTDMAVKTDPEFAKVANEFAKDQALFFKDYASAFSKLLHLGCTNQPTTEAPVLSEKDKAGKEFREYAMHGSTERMAPFKDVCDVHQQESDSGRTALHKAAFWGHIETINYLIDECKLDPNVQDANGDTALHDAVRFGHLAVSEKLLASKADKSIKNKAGQDVKALATEYEKPKILAIL